MKKLLALVLCVMLFVSVIPTSAFAETSISGSAIDLKPAYDARNTLFAALGVLGEAHMYKNAILGIRGYETAKTKDYFEKGDESPIGKLITALKGLEKVDLSKRTGMSYYGLAKLVAPIVVEAYNMAGNIVVLNVADKIAEVDEESDTGYAKDSLVGGVLTQVNTIIASFVPASSSISG